jgi:sugar phosphate isomerase/epimerase
MVRLALHTWTLDTTPLPAALAAAREAGWDGVELRRLDYVRAADAGHDAAWVAETVRAGGLPVACVGVEHGWMWAEGAERSRLLVVFDEQCARAAALGCATVMSPVDRTRGDTARAAASLREVGDIAARHGVRLAVEFNSQAEQVNSLEPMREILAKAGHPSCGLLLDTYHIQRSGVSLRAVEAVPAAEVVYVQYSDVPRTGTAPGQVLDRLPPGKGSVPFKDFFALMAAKGYGGFLSYEAPNTAAWTRPPLDVAREALAATRALL